MGEEGPVHRATGEAGGWPGRVRSTGRAAEKGENPFARREMPGLGIGRHEMAYFRGKDSGVGHPDTRCSGTSVVAPWRRCVMDEWSAAAVGWRAGTMRTGGETGGERSSGEGIVDMWRRRQGNSGGTGLARDGKASGADRGIRHAQWPRPRRVGRPRRGGDAVLGAPYRLRGPGVTPDAPGAHPLPAASALAWGRETDRPAPRRPAAALPPRPRLLPSRPLAPAASLYEGEGSASGTAGCPRGWGAGSPHTCAEATAGTAACVRACLVAVTADLGFRTSLRKEWRWSRHLAITSPGARCCAGPAWRRSHSVPDGGWGLPTSPTPQAFGR